MTLAIPSALVQTSPAQSTPAQADAIKLPAYDVGSIKLNKSGSGSVDIDSNISTYSATNVSLKHLLESAYDIKPDLISGIPGPLDSARFDIQAKIVEPDIAAIKKLSGKQQAAMLLPFLEDRFKIKAHTETKTLPVYELVVVPSGPKLTQSAAKGDHDSGINIHNQELKATDVSMASLASSLEGQVHRHVIDKTGLADHFDLTLKWTPDDGRDTQADSGPSIFTALQEQLGLKLQPAKGPVETLVIDHAEMPSEN
jgi:uncharacterized protein (TIGR03435 family)